MYLNNQTRNVIFLLICLPFRFLVAYLVSLLPIHILRFIGYIFLIPVIGWIRLSYKGKKIGFFGGKAWWAPLRLVHSLMYFLFAISSIYRYKKSYLILYLDVLIGFVAFIFNKILS